MAPRRNLPPCVQCGACCVAEFDTHYHAELNSTEVTRGVFAPRGRYSRYVVSTRDYGSDGWALATTWRAVRSGPLRGHKVCACALLRGHPLLEVSCAIYPNRPRVCREFLRGSKVCLAARQWLEDQVG